MQSYLADFVIVVMFEYFFLFFTMIIFEGRKPIICVTAPTFVSGQWLWLCYTYYISIYIPTYSVCVVLWLLFSVCVVK